MTVTLGDRNAASDAGRSVPKQGDSWFANAVRYTADVTTEPTPSVPREPAPTAGPSPDPTGAPRAGAASLWRRLSYRVVGTPWIVWTLVAINLLSAVSGYIYWYGSDILAAPLYLWPFVPDSPLSATLWAFALLAFHYGKRWEFLGLLAVTGCVKYGLWTDWVWFTNALSGGRYSIEAVVLSANHFGMVLEGLLLVPLLRPRLHHALLVAVWYGINDLADYGFGNHPRVPNPQDIELITAFAVGSTVVLVLWCFVRAYRGETAASG